MSGRLFSELDTLPPEVRADYLRILATVVADMPRRWHRFTGVPFVWYTIDNPGAAVRVEPTNAAKLCDEGGYPDEFSRWIGSVVLRRTREARCVALGKGNAIGAKMSPIPFGRADTRVDVIGHHVDRPLSSGFSLPFTRSGVVFKRIRFAPEVHQGLGEIHDA
jgi:hypothetical protein